MTSIYISKIQKKKMKEIGLGMTQAQKLVDNGPN